MLPVHSASQHPQILNPRGLSRAVTNFRFLDFNGICLIFCSTNKRSYLTKNMRTLY